MPLTEEQYLLACLAEECAEVIQEINKVLRFGLHHRWPTEADPSLQERLTKEMVDLTSVAMLLAESNIVLEVSTSAFDEKIAKVKKFMAYSRELGTLGAEQNGGEG